MLDTVILSAAEDLLVFSLYSRRETFFVTQGNHFSFN